ncbi:MAG: TPM domain-containing protein [Bacteroidetes bacterium]|nr:TPM domain-containing protein [Bacteroidota bacterium]
MIRQILLTFLLCLGLAFPASAQTVEDIIQNKNWVMDYAGLFSPQAFEYASDSLYRFSTRTGNQINILTLKEIPNGEDIFTFSMKVAEGRRIGQQGLDNGVLVVITTTGRREFRIYPGRGLEAVLPDASIKRFFREVAVPLLKAGEFDNVLMVTIGFIARAAEGEFAVAEKKKDGPVVPGIAFVIFIVVMILLFSVLSRLTRRSRSLGIHPGTGKRSRPSTDASALPFILPLIFGSGRGGGGFGGGSSGGWGGFSGGGGSFGGGGSGGSW